MAGKNRSPNYPSVGLGEAIEATKALYARSGRAALLPDAATLDMGYKSAHGPARAKLSALRKYGLLERVQGGKLRLSGRAITLIQPGADPHEYNEALRAAANAPALFSKYLGAFTPSNDALKLNLVREEGFSSSGADQFIKAFRDTKALVDNAGGAYTSSENDRAERDMGVDLAGAVGTGKTLLWQERGNVGAGLVVELRLEGESGRKITSSEFDRLEARLKLALSGLKDEVESGGAEK